MSPASTECEGKHVWNATRCKKIMDVFWLHLFPSMWSAKPPIHSIGAPWLMAPLHSAVLEFWDLWYKSVCEDNCFTPDLNELEIKHPAQDDIHWHWWDWNPWPSVHEALTLTIGLHVSYIRYGKCMLQALSWICCCQDSRWQINFLYVGRWSFVTYPSIPTFPSLSNLCEFSSVLSNSLCPLPFIIFLLFLQSFQTHFAPSPLSFFFSSVLSNSLCPLPFITFLLFLQSFQTHFAPSPLSFFFSSVLSNSLCPLPFIIFLLFLQSFQTHFAPSPLSLSEKQPSLDATSTYIFSLLPNLMRHHLQALHSWSWCDVAPYCWNIPGPPSWCWYPNLPPKVNATAIFIKAKYWPILTTTTKAGQLGSFQYDFLFMCCFREKI